MSFTISKRFDFSASHVLEGLPEGHQCGRLHGHNYSIELELTNVAVDTRGFVYDYGDLALFKELLETQLDHRHLNDVIPFNPTAEYLALWLFTEASGMFPGVAAVRVYETPKTCAEFRP